MKKLIACTCVLVILGSSGSFTYANQTTSKTETVRAASQSLQLVTPEKDTSISTNNLVLEFTAPKETRIRVLVYYNTSLEKDRENFVLAFDPILLEIGALQRGWAEVDLRRGINRIDIIAIYKDGTSDKITRLVTVRGVEDVKRYLENNTATTSASELLKGIVGTGKRP